MLASVLIDEYVAAFRRRSVRMAGPSGRVIDEDGIAGVADAEERHKGRLLVTDDSALGLLEELVGAAHVVAVLDRAPRCRQLMADSGAHAGSAATAMVCPDLSALPDVAFPAGLTVRRVRRLDGDDADWVPLEAAAAACLRAEEDLDEQLDDFVAYLRSLPSAGHLYAAVDDEGEVRATAAAGCFDADVNAFFISTDRAWRGRGVATAMTATVLRDARDRGGSLACLDASAAGRHIYERLGFGAAGDLTLFLGMG